MRPLLRRAVLLICVLSPGLAASSPPDAGAAIAQPNVNYDLGSPPAPSPASQNFLDVYRPDDSTSRDSRPVVVYVHGGGWRAGNKATQIADKVNLFTGAGYVFVSINYRLSPEQIDGSFPAERVRFPDHPDDVGEAIGWIDRSIAAYGGDPTRLLLIGHSAGAHLIALVSTDPSYVARYGVEPWQLIGTVPLDTDAYDVAGRIAEVGPTGRQLYYNAFGTPQEDAAEGTWGAASPLNWTGPGDPEFLLVTQGGNAGRVAGAERMAIALGQDPAGSVFRAPHDHAGINDAVGDAGDASGQTEAITGFFDRMVRASREPRAAIERHPRRRVRTDRRRARVRFAFTSDVRSSRFECRIERQDGFRACRSPYSRRMKAGRYRFRVRPIAPSGRPGEVVSFRFRVTSGG